jgi:hypothetical protein
MNEESKYIAKGREARQRSFGIEACDFSGSEIKIGGMIVKLKICGTQTLLLCRITNFWGVLNSGLI